jgi:hypothetical protein
MKKDEIRTQKQLEEVEKNFLAFLGDVSLKRRITKPHFFPMRTYGQRGMMLQWGDKSYSEAIESVQKLCPNISTTQIAKSISQLMRKIFQNQAVGENGTSDNELESIVEIMDTSHIASEIAQLISNVRKYSRRQIVLVPIEGLKMGIKSLAVGTVVFHTRSGENELDQSLENLKKDMEDEITSIEKDLKDISCYTRVDAIGDNEFARNEGIQRTREAIHILNLYLSSSIHQPSWESIRVARIIIYRALPDNEHKREEIGLFQSYPGGWPFEINDKREEGMTQTGLNIINDLFQPQNNNEIAKRIRQSVIWYSKAVDADSLEEKFVNLAIALECLVIGNEGKEPYASTGSINQKIGERVAFLLGDDLNSRVSFESKAKKLYGLRSAIVHTGASITHYDLAQMDELVRHVVFAFSKHGFSSWKKFLNWIVHERYNTSA